MSIALDPDIPAERQRLFLRAEPALPGLAWQIDRVPVRSPAGTSPPAGGRCRAGIISRSSIRTAG
ncbi:MAG: hypothetical protein M3461_10285 [Pseudomonadota bacterium]|nr:hypothetical protein [Pseudomonadota bacterium]